MQCLGVDLVWHSFCFTNIRFQFYFFGILFLDKETADFLFSVLPHSWLSTYQVHSPDRILEALQEVQQQTTNDLAYKVATAMALIGSFPPPTSS